jgi:hypothetical protein
MSEKPYRKHTPRGGGRQIVYIADADGNPLPLTTFNEQLAAAQIIQAQMLLGARREEAEASAAEQIEQLRRMRKWIEGE